MIETPVTRALDAQHIPYRVFQHPGEVASLEQAAQERGQLPEQVIRSIVFRFKRGESQDEYVMALMAGATQINWSALRKILGVSRVTMANQKELRAVTGYEIGAVAPFGLQKAIRVLADESVFVPEEISLGSGVRGVTVILTGADLKRALGEVEIVNLK